MSQRALRRCDSMLYPVHFSGLSFGAEIISDLSGRVPAGLTGLVGPNGVGKSVLLKLLAGLLPPARGHVLWHQPFLYVDQFAAASHPRVADALAVSDLFDAFQRIEQGCAQADDLDRVADHWDKPGMWHQQLMAAGLPADLSRPVATLSGGQQTRLVLCAAFCQPDRYLLLDEPGNHLDRRGREWLTQQLKQHRSGALLVSHDRQLLRHVDQILELGTNGLQSFGGNYDFYDEQRRLAVSAAEQKVMDTEKAMRRLKAEQQHSQQRAARRRHQGERQREDGSQGKMLLDFKAEKAQGSQARELAQQQRRSEQLSQELQAARALRDSLRPQKLVVSAPVGMRALVVHAESLMLPNLPERGAINLTVRGGERWSVCGDNGSGKSTLLKVIAGQLAPLSGLCEHHGTCLYLDQHFSFLEPELSALDNLSRLDPDVSAEQWRTWLGSLRLRADKALLPIKWLSGGERLKVALLAITGQRSPPDLLLLDEPDNHLDLDSRLMLEQALEGYQGTLMLVSHDPEFIDAVGVTHTLAMG
jgi:ATPase subunit of ABC transporter with duplicated ATPase domains